jgi:predicted PurR-regulated permease PerM
VYNKNMSNRQVIEISTRTIIKIFLLLLGIAALYYVRDIALVLLLSIVIASAIDPGVRRLQRWRFPRPLAVLSIYITTAAVWVLVFYLLVPPLISELRNFAVTFPSSLEDTFLQLRQTLSAFYSSAPGYISIPAESLTSQLNAFINGNVVSFFTAGTSVGSSLFGGVLSFVLTIVLSFYFAVQENGIANVLKIITPLEHEQYVVGLWTRSQHKISKWLQGQLMLGVLVGFLVYLGLTFLGVKYALILAFLAAIFELIPIFGPILAAIPSVMLAFIQAPVLALWVVLLYVIVQQMENHLIYPLVVRKAVGVPPLLVIIALLIGGKLGGFIGFILAVPIASAFLEYINDIVKEKHIFPDAGESASD